MLDDHYITVPTELVKQECQLGFDFGGSLLKVIINERLNQPNEDNQAYFDGKDTGKLRAFSFKRENWQDAADLIKNNTALMNKNFKAFCTGVGSTSLAEQLEKSLNCKIKVLSEYDCFVYAFRYLIKTLPRKTILVYFPKEEIEVPLQTTLDYAPASKKIYEAGESNRRFIGLPDPERMRQVAIGLHRGSDTTEEPLEKAESDSLYPLIIAMVGSAIGYFKVESDGSFAMVDINFRGGRSVYGLATLLTGNKNFDDFMDMATRGEKEKIHAGVLDVAGAEVQDESVYSSLRKFTNNVPLFNFGKVAGKDRDLFSTADIAAAFLHHACQDIAHATMQVAHTNGCRRVFYSGNFVKSDLVRRLITSETARRACFLNGSMEEGNIQKEGITIDFVKSGGYLGALGCMLNCVQPFLPRDVHVTSNNISNFKY